MRVVHAFGLTLLLAACTHANEIAPTSDGGTHADGGPTGDGGSSASDSGAPSDGGTPTSGAAAEQVAVIQDAQGIAASATELFVSTSAAGTGGVVLRMDNKPGATAKSFVSLHPHPGLVAYDPFPVAPGLVWVDLDEKAVYHVDIGGGGMRDVYPTNIPRPQSLGAAAAGEKDGIGDLYVWTDPVAGDIVSFKVVNSFIAHNQQGVTGITLHRTGAAATDPADYAIWTRPDAGEISRAGLTSGAGSGGLLLSNEAEPYGITCDDQFIYWTNKGDGTIVRAALDGSSRTVLATGQDTPLGIAVDAKYVYWVSSGSGAIMRLAK